MEFSLSTINLFCDIFDIYKNYCQNIKMYLSNNGIHLQSSDTANISIIDIKLNYNYFDTYLCNIEKTIDFNLEDICKILKICKKSKSTTHFNLEDNIFKITTVSNNIKKTFKINSIYTTTQDLIDINLLEVNNIFEINSELLKSIFDDFILFSSEITIKLNNSNLYFYTNNDNIDTVYHYKTPNLTLEDSQYESVFSLDYLHKFKLIKCFDTCNLKFTQNSPIFLSSPENRDMQINFILAPKII